MKQKIIAWMIQFYTGMGIITGMIALRAALSGDMRSAFAWLAASTFIDGTDGTLARGFRTPEVLPEFNGRKLDDIVDYFNYVIIPAIIMVRAHIFPSGAWGWALIPLLSSAYGFCQEKAKTDDGYFTGFPSYWNIVALYLLLLDLPRSLNLLIVSALGILVFVPLKYIDPFKTKPLRQITRPLTVAWALSVVALVLSLPYVSPALLRLSLAYCGYYFIASFLLHSCKR
ncbi:MAG: CDP-diacylglycerol O-phosphatidyltransferase [Candidatus Aureabacteria bacterium]|nr:CDP-diacylglycerol O-phosphatidyltransferase [Candidatus Auribacterota bacterium]